MQSFPSALHSQKDLHFPLFAINIIQSECWSPDISGVYGSIMVKFCEKVGIPVAI